LSTQVGALEQQAAERARDTAEMQRREHDLSAENLLISAQLAELRTRMADSEQVKQMTMQLDAAQARSRMQYEALQREIDSLRRANYTLSQSYQMLQSVTKFGFLPDGTSLETALQMMRNLTVFQQDLATLREENTVLRKKAVADV
jgi:regulator of replication initiation timing